MSHGKKYLEAAKAVERERVYPPVEAAALLKQTSVVAFDATTEVHIRLGVDPRHADQMVRGTVSCPTAPGSQVRVLVFAQGEKAREAMRRRRRVRRRRGPREEDRVGLARVRRRPRDARHDGHGRQAREDPRQARPHAEPQVGHDHLRPVTRRPRGQGGPRGVQGRQGRDHPRRASARPRSPTSSSSRTWPPSSTRSTARSRRPPRASTSRD